MRQAELNEIRNRAVNEAAQVKIEDVLTIAGYTGKKRLRGTNLFFECPYCYANKLDKCSANIYTNLGKCFSCDQGFGPAKLCSSIMGIPYIDAALLLAVKSGGISITEYEEVMKNHGNYTKLSKDTAVLQKIEQKRAVETSEHKAPSEILDLVYSTMLNLDEFKLSDKHRDYLVSERKLNEAEIKKGRFFSYQKSFDIDMLIKIIQRTVPSFSYNNLVGVPGFYFEFSDSSHTKGRWAFRNPYENCLGIPLFDCEGRIVALQLRCLGKVQDCRYFFLTSRGYQPSENVETGYGSTPGTPAHVEYPEIIKNTTIIIGEGKFKMVEAAREGSISVSCQGVNNYSYAVEEIEKVFDSKKLKSYPKLKPVTKDNVNFIIAFDADMFRKKQVLDAAIGTGKELYKRFLRPVYYLVWDSNLGKGYDDLKANMGAKFKDYCFTVRADKFITLAEKSLDYCNKKYNNDFKSQDYKDELEIVLWKQGLNLKNVAIA